MRYLSRLSALLLLVSVRAIAGEGHDAGYNWAGDRGIDDPDDCYSRNGGAINNSPSFTEGCLEYLQDEGVTDENDELTEDDDYDDEY